MAKTPKKSSGIADLVASTANRLRTVQLDFADGDPADREGHLSDALGQVVRGLPATERPAFLARLLDEFPSWDRQVDVVPRAPEVPASTVDEKDLSDASFLLSRLIDVARSLSEVERQVIKDRLAAAGLSDAKGPAAWRADVAETLRKQLRLKHKIDFDPTRVLEALAVLAEKTRSIDQLAWTTWREIAPESRMRRPPKMMQNLAMFVVGDADVSRGQIATDVEALRRLFAALVLGVKDSFTNFARDYLETSSPGAIMDLARRRDEKKWSESWEQYYWRVYEQLAESLGETKLEHGFRKALAEYVEKAASGSSGA